MVNEMVKIVGDTPIGAGGHANILEATLDGRDVILKSYRLYEIGGIERTFLVRNQRSFSYCTTYILFQRYHKETVACAQLSHPNVVPFLGVTSSPSYSLSLVFNTAGYLGLREYLDKSPGVDKLKLVRRLSISSSAPPGHY
jgi:hypothetical protein